MKRKTLTLLLSVFILALGACENGSLPEEQITLFRETLDRETTGSLPLTEDGDLFLEDGHYFALESGFDEEGWKLAVSFEVNEGIMENLEFDAVHEFAASTKRSLSYRPEYGLPWDEQLTMLENFIILNQDTDLGILENGRPALLHSFSLPAVPFLNLLYTAILEGPQEPGPYLDGIYFAEQGEFNEDTGFNYFINMIVRDGRIIAVHWNALTEAGTRKYEPLLPDTVIELENEPEDWHYQARDLEQFLLEIQDPTEMTFNLENRTDDLFTISIEVNYFIELAVRALGAGPLILQ